MNTEKMDCKCQQRQKGRLVLLVPIKDYLAFGEALNSTWEWGKPIDKAPQTNPDSWPRSAPALELHSRAASSVSFSFTVPAVPTQEAIPEEGGLKK